MPEVIYLGYRINKEGLYPRFAAILKAPASKNLTELRTFLKLLNYYKKFLSTVLALVLF